MAWDEITRADTILIIGFSFPATDFHADALFATACRAAGRVVRVILCHKKSEGDDTVNRIRRIFSFGRKVRIIPYDKGLTESFVGRLRSWLV